MHPSYSSIRIGVLGLGRAGMDIHVKALTRISRFSITAVCDATPGRARDIAGVLPGDVAVFESLDSLLASGLCDLVVIATPSQQHFEEAKAVLEAGHHCLLEKPMASSGAEAFELAELAQKQGRHLFVHHQYLFSDELLFLQEVIAAGEIGQLFHIEIFWTSFTRRWDWQTLRKNKGGLLLNTCPHVISMLLPLLGGDLKVEATDLRLIKDAGDTEDHARFFLRGCNGVTASVMVSSVCALPLPRLTLFGSTGSLQEDFTRAILRTYDASSVPERQAIDGPAPMDGSLREQLPWKEEERPVRPSRPMESFHEHVAAVLLDGAPCRATAEEAARVTEILETIANFSHPVFS